ncbi:hypothetical protein NUW58_g2605 [Xylaria curta]|uniref:Uncharacterized protein n=1 Tax=Xylaria curta TaxID=42375 RepID=A0ACC1PER1_9PEZI|nr:hypothetical protein NUW58_g2605 [Xylaria curta]
MSSSSTTSQASALDSGMEALAGLNLLSLQETQGATSLIDTTAAISSMVDQLSGLPTTPPSLFIDLEGVELSRHGTISIMQIHNHTNGQNYLVDVKTLGRGAFSTPGALTVNTLKAVLESSSIPKVFFDVRNDSDALYSHYGIELRGAQDLQLMELAARAGSRKFISGLKKCIENDMPMTSIEKDNRAKAKDEGLKLFAPEKGGSYEVFNQRPLPEKIRIYCVQDVHYLPRLWEVYNRKLSARWRAKVQDATEHRVMQSQAPDYNGKGRHMTLAPRGW